MSPKPPKVGCGWGVENALKKYVQKNTKFGVPRDPKIDPGAPRAALEGLLRERPRSRQEPPQNRSKKSVPGEAQQSPQRPPEAILEPPGPQ